MEWYPKPVPPAGSREHVLHPFSASDFFTSPGQRSRGKDSLEPCLGEFTSYIQNLGSPFLARKSFSGDTLWDVAFPAGVILWASYPEAVTLRALCPLSTQCLFSGQMPRNFVSFSCLYIIPLSQQESPWLGSSKPDRQFQRCSNTGSGSCLVECACVCTCVCMFYSCLAFFSPSPCPPNSFPVKLISLAAEHHLGKALGKQRPP